MTENNSLNEEQLTKVTGGYEPPKIDDEASIHLAFAMHGLEYIHDPETKKGLPR